MIIRVDFFPGLLMLQSFPSEVIRMQGTPETWTRREPDKEAIMMQETKAAEGSESPKTVVFDAEARAKYVKARRELRGKLRPLTEAVRHAERLSKDDFAIRINARD